MTNDKKVREPLLHISKRTDITKKQALYIRLIAIGAVVILSILLSLIFVKRGPIFLIVSVLQGTFGDEFVIWELLYKTAILLCISLAVVPAFKMKFWNIGADGQTLMAVVACYGTFYYLRGTGVPNFLIAVFAFVMAVLIGVIWAVIPAIFKAQWNTNETLFTLMMNYIAIQIAKYFILLWSNSNGTTVPPITQELVPYIFNEYVFSILSIAVLTAAVYVYLKDTKQGFEISLVGESQNTAKYIGLNVKKVIIRTMIISGAICGLAGYILVAISKGFNENIVAGMGFTAIIVAWLAKFNPLYMILSAFVVQFLQLGLKNFIDVAGIGSKDFAQIIIGLVYLFIIGSEFFIQYKVKFKKKNKEDVK